ncbi:MAG: hypothetical protein SOU32_06235 [Lachnospiraceae bacterium]|nr:hypothetical protein [Lachnospiraceae bacterium]
MSEEESRFIYLNGEPVPVSEEVYLTWYRPIWRIHDFARRHGQCDCPNWHLCEGDCAICRHRWAGDHSSLERLFEKYELEQEDFGSNPEDIVLDAMALEELLNELDRIDPDGSRIAEVLMDDLNDRDAARVLGMAKSTYSGKKMKLRRKLKERRDDGK